MAISWKDGSLQGILVKWIHVEGIAMVDPNKELLSVELLLEQVGSFGTIYWDNLGLFRNLTNDKVLGNYIIYMPIESGVTEKPVFGAVVDSVVVAAHIIPKEAITGSDSPPTLKLWNVETNELICTKTFTLGVNANPYELVSFGPTDSETREINLGMGVKLESTGIGEFILVLEWNLV